MKNLLGVVSCLFLISCGEAKTRGLALEINLFAQENEVFRCQSDNQEIIKVTEENFTPDKNNDLSGQYQFKFTGVGVGTTTITCNYLKFDEVKETYKYYVEVDDNNFIKYIKKDGNDVEKISDPVFK